MYEQAPSAAELAAIGMLLTDLDDTAVEVWPDNWPAIQLFAGLSTQWRAGAAGPIGLDYNVVFHELDRKSLAPDVYDDMLASIRVIESAALEILHEKS